MTATRHARHDGAVVSAGILLGTGLGGFVDGILLHQILQWHNMLSTVHPPTDLVTMKYNMVWDGLFHAFTWIMVVLGVVRLWTIGARDGLRGTGMMFAGSLAAGWGLFNVVEGLIDHELLGVHHVHPGENELAWDIGFLVLGAGLLAAGAIAIARGRRGPDGPGVRDGARSA